MVDVLPSSFVGGPRYDEYHGTTFDDLSPLICVVDEMAIQMNEQQRRAYDNLVTALNNREYEEYQGTAIDDLPPLISAEEEEAQETTFDDLPPLISAEDEMPSQGSRGMRHVHYIVRYVESRNLSRERGLVSEWHKSGDYKNQ